MIFKKLVLKEQNRTVLNSVPINFWEGKSKNGNAKYKKNLAITKR